MEPTMNETQRAGPTSFRRDWAALAALMLGYTLLFAVFYPPTFGIEDEAGYLNQALVWSRGSFTAEGAGFDDLSGFFPVGGQHIAVRQPGRSLTVLPFWVVGGMRAVFISGLLIHLATAAVAGAILARLGRSPLWAAFVLFHPTLAIYSRTVMADGGAGLGLLLAALALVHTESRFAGAWAGLGVGLAALMRYHGGIALPFVAASFRYPPVRPHPWRQAALCLLTGGLCGGLVVAYNLWLFHHPTDPNPAMRGSFGARYFVGNATFYATALMVIWPGMLLAPLLDRSLIRWNVRGVCGLYLVFFLFYYWHDTGSSWIETAIVGQRLIQVALPLWIVSYVGVVDDRLAGPLRRVLGRRAWSTLAAATCVALLAANGLIFAKHQGHLKHLLAVRDTVAHAIPDGAVVAANGNISKLFGVPSGPPSYRFLALPEVLNTPPASASRWYVAVLAKSPADESLARDIAARYKMTPVPTDDPQLSLFVVDR
jgi:hypothetical protein